jgi:hypothetical protein
LVSRGFDSRLVFSPCFILEIARKGEIAACGNRGIRGSSQLLPADGLDPRVRKFAAGTRPYKRRDDCGLGPCSGLSENGESLASNGKCNLLPKRQVKNTRMEIILVGVLVGCYFSVLAPWRYRHSTCCGLIDLDAN